MVLMKNVVKGEYAAQCEKSEEQIVQNVEYDVACGELDVGMLAHLTDTLAVVGEAAVNSGIFCHDFPSFTQCSRHG